MEEHAEEPRRSFTYQANGTLQAYMTQLGSDSEAKQTTEEATPGITHDLASVHGQEASAPRQSDDGDDDYSVSDHDAEPAATAAATTLEPHAEQDDGDDDYSVSDNAEPTATAAATTLETHAEQDA